MLLAELSYFSRQLCTKEIMVELMVKLEKEIPVGVFLHREEQGGQDRAF
jgi:hypothetical protein